MQNTEYAAKYNTSAIKNLWNFLPSNTRTYTYFSEHLLLLRMKSNGKTNSALKTIIAEILSH